MLDKLLTLELREYRVSASAIRGLEPREVRLKLQSGCSLRTTTITSVYTVCNEPPEPTKTASIKVPVPTMRTTTTPPIVGACRTTSTTSVSGKKTVTAAVKICPYPPFTIPLTEEPPAPTEKPLTSGKPPTGNPSTSTGKVPTDEEDSIDEEEIEVVPDKPPTTTELLDGACREPTTTTIVSGKQTITRTIKFCPYPPFTFTIGEEPTPTGKPSTDEDEEVPIVKPIASKKPTSSSSSEPLDGACQRTTTITSVSGKETITKTVKFCPYPPFTITIGEEPTPTGKPSRTVKPTPVVKPTPIGKPSTEEDEEVPVEKPILGGACRTITITTVSKGKTIMTVAKHCPYPPFTIPITDEPAATGKPSTDGDEEEVSVKKPIPSRSSSPSPPIAGGCRTTTITSVSGKKTTTTVARICPFPPFTIPITEEPAATGKPSTEEAPTEEVPTEKPPTSTELLDGACVTSTIKTVSNRRTYTKFTTLCPYPTRNSPVPVTPKPKTPTPSPIGKGTTVACPPSKVRQVFLSCAKEQLVPCKTPCKTLVTVTSTGACSCIGAKQQVTGTTLGPTMCPNNCGCTTSTVWDLPAGCKTTKSEPPKPTVEEEQQEEEDIGGYY
ncbi:hypothetical protein TWF481_005949 [Arthrobotrys musiformis]|uniref:Uncharacterized protein n=1 Tax=Arthrobotrys musiformis TaxID=47236 RepID=A0AAV9WFF6_9PEZI